MSDFQFLKNPVFHNWVISAPRRANRPDVASGMEPVCPFCPGREGDEREVYRVPAEKSHIDFQKTQNTQQARESDNQRIRDSDVSDFSGSSDSPSVPSLLKQNQDWLVRVLPNKFPFAPIHEIIIHSPDHHANFGELPVSQVELILQTYRNRYQQHQKSGEVYIFHNRGEAAGESLPHPHTQLAVIPFEVKIDIPRLDPFVSYGYAPRPQTPDPVQQGGVDMADMVETGSLYLFCPKTSQWPDEVWVAPKNRGRAFGEITDEEIKELAITLTQLIKIFDLRHGHEFPYNFYIYPGGDWYLRIIPRLKRLGGFEIGTSIYINTQDPKDSLSFIKEHFNPPAGGPDEEKISTVHRAEYHKTV